MCLRVRVRERCTHIRLHAHPQHTPSTNTDHELIATALSELEKVTLWVNEEKRKHFNEKRLFQIAQSLEGEPVAGVGSDAALISLCFQGCLFMTVTLLWWQDDSCCTRARCRPVVVSCVRQ